MLPYSNHFPAHLFECIEIPIVSTDVGLNFSSPKGIEFIAPLLEFIPVPEITVDEYCQLTFGKYDIRTAR
jgi:hypothetical protein